MQIISLSHRTYYHESISFKPYELSIRNFLTSGKLPSWKAKTLCVSTGSLQGCIFQGGPLKEDAHLCTGLQVLRWWWEEYRTIAFRICCREALSFLPSRPDTVGRFRNKFPSIVGMAGHSHNAPSKASLSLWALGGAVDSPQKCLNDVFIPGDTKALKKIKNDDG